ncbi:MAG: hypothetical protein EON60_08775 [Alphaproteobacteria bacterium]|nr:MAG: hypothetical protein EON60_08775 [Alphaproteobacteria bacterium]
MPLKIERKPITARRVMLFLAILVLIPVIGFMLVLVTQQTRLILPARVNNAEPPPASLHPQYLSLPTPSGATLQGVLFPAKTASPTLILAFPGNTHNAVGFAAFLKETVFPDDDIAVAAFSYRGYPNGITPPSTGTPSQAGLYADSLLIYDVLTTRLQPKSVKVAAYSIGTAVATHLALNRPVDKMLLAAPIASVRRIAQERYPWVPVRLLLRHPFATEDVIAALTNSTTIIYSPTDGLVPRHHVEDILHTANPSIPLIAVPGTNHVTLILHPETPALIRKALTD